MITISLDTNFVIPRMLYKKDKTRYNLLDTMILLQKRGLVKICLPEATQAEIYAVLRAGRYPIKVNGKKEHCPFPHHIILKLADQFSEIFNIEFLEKFKTTNFGLGDAYKTVLFDNMRFILGMNIEQSKQFVLNRGIHLEKCSDKYDYHIMVSVFKCNADYLVTLNTRDFPTFLGKCEIINTEKLLTVLPNYP